MLIWPLLLSVCGPVGVEMVPPGLSDHPPATLIDLAGDLDDDTDNLLRQQMLRPADGVSPLETLHPDTTRLSTAFTASWPASWHGRPPADRAPPAGLPTTPAGPASATTFPPLSNPAPLAHRSPLPTDHRPA